MNQQAYSALATMMNSFSTGREDIELRLHTFDAVLKDVPTEVVIDTAKRFTAGEVGGQNASFAPSVAEFTQEAKRVAELKAAIARPRLTAPEHRSGKLAPFEINRNKARTKWANWTVFKEDVSYDQWCNMSRTREVPVGAVWVAALATVFLPPVMQ